MPGGFEPQTGEIKHVTVSVPDAQVATGKIIPLLIASLGSNENLEVLSVQCVSAVIGTTVPFDLKSSSGATPTETTIATAVSAVTARTAKVPFLAYRGSSNLDDGDMLQATFGTVTAGSVSGVAFGVEYRVTRHS